MMRFSRSLAIVALLAPILTACLSTRTKAPPLEHYRSPSIAAVQRVLVLPFTPEGEFPDQAEMVTARFTQAIRAGSFSVLPLPEAAITTDLVEDVRLRGSVKAADLARLENEYRVDAVVIGAVTRYDPYAPQVLGLDVKLVSTRSGVILWQARKVFDASEEPISNDALSWYDRFVEETEAEFGPQVVLLSPRAFARYACSRMAESMVAEKQVAKR